MGHIILVHRVRLDACHHQISGSVTFRIQMIEQTEVSLVAYVTDVANIHETWFSYGMTEFRICGHKLFAIDITAHGHRGF